VASATYWLDYAAVITQLHNLKAARWRQAQGGRLRHLERAVPAQDGHCIFGHLRGHLLQNTLTFFVGWRHGGLFLFSGVQRRTLV